MHVDVEKQARACVEGMPCRVRVTIEQGAKVTRAAVSCPASLITRAYSNLSRMILADLTFHSQPYSSRSLPTRCLPTELSWPSSLGRLADLRRSARYPNRPAKGLI
eukprot:3774889-Rhodomonas_salina.2